MLTKLTLYNLGCFDNKPKTIDFSKVTPVVGPNNSGKSMAFVGLNLIKLISFYGGVRWINEYFNLQNFENVVHNHINSSKIGVTAVIDSQKIMIELGKNSYKFSLNGKNVAPNSMYKWFSNIWYVQPNRAMIPFSSDVKFSGLLHQPIHPNGSNILNFLVEKSTQKDKNWPLMETWLKKIDQNISETLLPVKSGEAYFENKVGNVSINISSMGSGIQSILTVMAAAIFAPDNSTIIIEEPEAFLHPRSQESIVDLFNFLAKNQNKQIIFSTHSWSMLLPYIKDIVGEQNRGTTHVSADKNNFGIAMFNNKPTFDIENYSLSDKTFQQAREKFKNLWG